MPEVGQHRSRPSPAPRGRASTLQHNKLQNNPAKQGGPPRPTGRGSPAGWAESPHPSTCCTSSSRPTPGCLHKKVPPQPLLPAPHPGLPGCQISERQSPSRKAADLFILSVNSIKQTSRREQERSPGRRAESTGRSSGQRICSFPSLGATGSNVKAGKQMSHGLKL